MRNVFFAIQKLRDSAIQITDAQEDLEQESADASRGVVLKGVTTVVQSTQQIAQSAIAVGRDLIFKKKKMDAEQDGEADVDPNAALEE